ncbi:CYTH domain-containing protein [Paucisalibacillus sp. EB02]|uniref:CYTH domain-containing protein n=1 Tax=Paucisalibacillus sp. EB02 TaxID=1347087 RepID=UPI0005A5EAAF|nr:CYTH domain-containing protein [Paucisalibacillus sp. EB02]
MAQEIEIEFKNLLTKAEYEILLNYLPFPSVGKKQINYYFETIDFKLRQHKSALRIREKNGKYQLTLKEPFGDGLLETHDSLIKEEVTEWLNGNPVPKAETSEQLSKMNISINELQYYGSLSTIRREYIHSGLIYVLDHSSYHNHEDYELEIEAKDKESGLKALETILMECGITRKETPNKIARFFQKM